MNRDTKVRLLVAGANLYVPSLVEGPQSTTQFGENKGWRQHLRRLTFYAATTYGVVAESVLMGEAITNADDQEWLNLYHHIAMTTDIIQCGCFPAVEVLMLLTLPGRLEKATDAVRQKIKQSRNTLGQAVVETPWLPTWDRLGADVRSTSTVLVTDLTYYTQSNQGNVHDIEVGVQNIGVKTLKVFQMDYDQRNNPEALYSLFASAATYLTELKNDQKSVTVHVWLSFNTLIKGQDRHFEDVDGYVERVANHIEVLQEYSPTPVFVILLSDANFLGSKASIAPLVNELATRLRSVGILQSKNDKFWRGMYACGGDPHFWKKGEKKEIIWAYIEKMLFRQKMMLLCGLDDSLMSSINEECIHQTNSKLDLQLVQDCTSWPSVIPRDTESSTQKNSDSSKVLGSMIDLKRLNKRTRWNDVRRGIFRPEPNYDPDEFWLEVHPLSDFICESCSAAVEHGNVWNTNTECYRSCLNCAANWNRMSSYENQDPYFNEHEMDAQVAARLINIYNTSWDWREITATQDLKAFMVTAALSMISAYRTSGDVLKQVSHRGAIRLPVKMIKGKCKRHLLGQFAVQRESIVDVDERNMTTTRWFYRLTWDGGNVAYHDYVKTVLSNDEFYSIFGSHASTEYVGDIMEFWLGMFELAIQFPMLFNGWGRDHQACLSGIEESFWMFTNSCRQATTDNSKRRKTKKVIVPTVEVQVVNKVLTDAGVFGLLATHSITRMPNPPMKRDDLPIEISSDEEEEETGDFMPTAEEAPY
eukprot:s70_g4.t1